MSVNQPEAAVVLEGAGASARLVARRGAKEGSNPAMPDGPDTPDEAGAIAAVGMAVDGIGAD